MSTIGILGYYGAGNLGDELLLRSTLEMLSSLGSFKIFVFSEKPAETKIFFPDCKAIDKFKPTALISALMECEALIVGGGSIFQDVSSFRSLLYYVSVCLLACLLGKKLILLGQGVGPLNSTISRWLTRIVYQLAHSVSVRDLESFDLVKDWNAQIKFSGDLAWTLPNVKTLSEEELKTKKQKSLVVSLRTDKVSEKQVECFARFLKENFADYKINFLALQRQDVEVLNEIAEKLDLAEVFAIYNYGGWKQYGIKLFQEADFCFAMRFHALLLAIKSGTAAVGISYDPKVRALCKEAHLPFIELKELNSESLLECLRTLRFPTIGELRQFSEHKAEVTRQVNCAMLKDLLDALTE